MTKRPSLLDPKSGTTWVGTALAAVGLAQGLQMQEIQPIVDWVSQQENLSAIVLFGLGALGITLRRIIKEVLNKNAELVDELRELRAALRGSDGKI